MVLPNLIHPVDIDVEQIDRSTTIYDPDAREPVQKASRKTVVTVKGQPRWTDSQKELEMFGFGPSDRVRGYVLFRYVDLAAAGLVLQKNDRMIMQGHLVDSVYIIRLQPMAHYQDQDGVSLVRAFFSDRLPAKEP